MVAKNVQDENPVEVSLFNEFFPLREEEKETFTIALICEMPAPETLSTAPSTTGTFGVSQAFNSEISVIISNMYGLLSH